MQRSLSVVRQLIKLRQMIDIPPEKEVTLQIVQTTHNTLGGSLEI